MSESRTLIEQACEQWIQDLADLSRRNNLLYHRDLKLGSIAFNNFISWKVDYTSLPPKDYHKLPLVYSCFGSKNNEL